MRARVSSSARVWLKRMRLLEQAGERVRRRGGDRRLRVGDGVGRERGDAPRERVDERVQLVRVQGAVDVPPALGGLGVDVATAEDDLERAAAADQRRQPLRPAAAGDDPHRDLGLGQDGPAARGEAHVHAQHELAAAAPGTALDDRDRRLGHGPEAVDHGREQRQLGRLGLLLLRQLQDQAHVRVGDEEVGVRAVDDDHPHVVIGFGLTAEAVHLHDHRPVEQVDGRVIDGRVGDAVVGPNLQRLVAVRVHARDRNRLAG